jgi:hypothetical protein
LIGMEGKAMFGLWQPYPNHPQVQDLRRRLEDVQERLVGSLGTGDAILAQRLAEEISSVREELHRVTAALLQDDSLVPRWTEHTEADAAAGAVPCLECGNNIRAAESCCSYCGWTYLDNAPTGDTRDRRSPGTR